MQADLTDTNCYYYGNINKDNMKLQMPIYNYNTVIALFRNSHKQKDNLCMIRSRYGR